MALVGDLKEISIATLLQLNCVERNTAQLTVSTPIGPAIIYLDKGEIVDACYAGLRGEEAIYRILRLSQGEFRVAEIEELPDRTISASWQSLLLEGMRVLDETEKGRSKIAQSIGSDVENAPEVKSYVIASKRGDIFATNRDQDADKLAAAATLLAWKGQEVSSRLGLGELDFARLVFGNSLTFFLDCGDLVAVIMARKAAMLDPLYALIDDIRKKLRYFELTPLQQGVEIVG